MELVFVYGTLRRGHGNHVLLEKSRLVDVGFTENKYAMYATGIPFVNDEEEISRIFGEVYEVSPSRLKLLDTLEGHPGWYERKKVTILGNAKNHKAWLYFNNDKSGRLIESGDYEERV